MVTVNPTMGLRGTVLPLGWQLPQDLTEAEWRQAGALLGKVERSASWWLGDWWAFGEARYGQRKAVVQADDWEGPSFGTCMNAGRVCAAFETSRRHEVLSFAHHAEVAALPSAEADAFLDWAAEAVFNSGKPRSTRELRARVAQRRNSVGSVPSSDTCTIADLHDLAAAGTRFGCIYSDPPPRSRRAEREGFRNCPQMLSPMQSGRAPNASLGGAEVTPRLHP